MFRPQLRLTWVKLLVFWLTLLLTASGLIWLLPPETVVAQAPAQTIFSRVNQFRVDNGLPAFVWNNALGAAAQEQANYMAEFNIYSHTGYGGSRPYDRAASYGYAGWVSENIVGGTNLTPRAGLIWWINSPVHLNTLLTTRYVQAGTGYAFGHEQSFYALVVGLPDDGPASAPKIPDDSPDPIFVTPIEVSAAAEDGSIVHIVQEGQTAWAIAAVYEADLNYILYVNSLQSGGFLVPGDALIVQLGEGQEPPPTATPASTHITREGETLWSIAARYDLTLSEILWFNSLSADHLLHPGEELVVRLLEGQQLPPTSTPQLTHFIKSGETLSGIAVRYGLFVTDLLSWNGLDSNAVLQIGQELRIRPLPAATATTPIEEVVATSTATPTPTVMATEAPQAVALVAETSVSAQLGPVAAIAPATPISDGLAPAEAVQEDGPITPFVWITAGLLLLGAIGMFLIRRAF